MMINTSITHTQMTTFESGRINIPEYYVVSSRLFLVY